MTDDSIASASKRLKAVAAKAGKAEQRLDAAREKVARIIAQRADGVATTADLRAHLTTAAVKATLDGSPMPQPDAALADKLRAAESLITGADHARPIAEAEANTAAEALKQAVAEVTAAKIAWFSALQEDAAAEVRTLLEPLAKPLARLRAIDRAQAAIIGEYFPARQGNLPKPWSGQTVANRLLAGIVPRLRPEAFTDEALAELSAAESTLINQHLKEITQ